MELTLGITRHSSISLISLWNLHMALHVTQPDLLITNNSSSQFNVIKFTSIQV